MFLPMQFFQSLFPIMRFFYQHWSGTFFRSLRYFFGTCASRAPFLSRFQIRCVHLQVRLEKLKTKLLVRGLHQRYYAYGVHIWPMTRRPFRPTGTPPRQTFCFCFSRIDHLTSTTLFTRHLWCIPQERRFFDYVCRRSIVFCELHTYDDRG